MQEIFGGLRRGLVVISLAVFAVGIAGCGTSHHVAPTNSVPSVGASGHHVLRIAPARPSPRSEIAFRFVAPLATGRHGSDEIDYSLSITGPAGEGCDGAQEATGAAVPRAGLEQTITVGPRQTRRHRPWCTGSYTARVLELARAYCRSGQACPQFIRVVGVVASGAYAVRR